MRQPRHPKPASNPPNLPVLVRTEGREIALPEDLIASAKGFAAQARAPATLKAYAVWWRDFNAWCEAHGRDPLPASIETITAYMAALGTRTKTGRYKTGTGLAISSLNQAAAAVRFVQESKRFIVNYKDPDYRNVMRGIRRDIASKRTIRKVKPLSAEIIRDLLDSLDPSDPTQARDRAAISLGFAAALRRSELVTLDWERFGGHPTSKGFVVADERAVVITLLTSKASQDAAQDLIVPRNDVPRICKAVEEWVKVANIQPGAPLFPGGFTSGGYEGEVYKGVSWSAKDPEKPWRAKIRRSDVAPTCKAYRELGYHKTQEAAIAAYVAAGGVREVRIRAARMSAMTVAAAIKARVAAFLEKEMGRKKKLKPAERRALSALYSGHSMRAGHVTDGFKRKRPIYTIKAMTRHKTDGIVLGYARQTEALEDNSLKGIGL